MGTISDKLMRIINTKEDIRQALISKGYDVPTSIPFKEYAKMISDLPCRVDSFPDIEGIVARYSALGLTNEQMAANPVWVDKTGNGHDLQMKNFAWKGMSGVNGYKFDFLLNEWVTSNEQISEKYSYKIVINNKQNSVQLINNSVHIKITLKITGIEINKSIFRVYDNAGMEHKQDYTKDGIYEIDYTANEGANRIYFYVVGGNIGQLENPITIEQLPLYPGFILGDGVDDFAVTEKELNFEDTYTVYTAFIPLQNDPIKNMIVCGKDYKKDFYINYGTQLVFYTANSTKSIPLHINQFTVLLCKRDKTTGVIKNLVTGESFQFSVSQLISNPGLYYLWRSATVFSYGKTAIAGQTICNGYFSTDEDDEKVLDWYKKQYPWLFPDQAWTVTGKTNEDADRDTIANITGNGNDLVLSNFGFAEGSGYGLYYQYFGNEFKATNGEIEGGGWNIIDNYNISHDKRIPINYIGKCFWGNKALVNGIKLRFKLTGMTEGDVLAFGYAATYDLTYTSDGIYAIDLPPVDRSYGFSLQSSLTENLPTTPVTIELLPFEYEGYLVTDGVDDKVQSSSFTMNEDWTIVGDWELLSNVQINCGIVKAQNVYLYNIANGLLISINNPRSLQSFGTKSLHAICSDGRLYDRNWVEYKYTADQNFSIVESSLNIGFNLNNYTQVAFKNLGIYNNQLLSKDDCIKAYNYLQTLKSK